MKSKRYLPVIAVVLCLAACSSGSSPAAATVSGTITNGDQFAKITFTPDGGGTPVEVACTVGGTYSATLPAGIYDLVALRPGYVDDAANDVDVVSGADTVTNFTLVALPANEYIGSESCAVCHQAKYDMFRNTGHPFKISKVQGGVAPTLPFSALPADIIARIADDGLDNGAVTDPNGTQTDNPQGTPGSWNDVSYLIGGYFWKSRFIDTAGWIVTGTSVQYNYETDGMAAYHNNEGWPDPVPPGAKGPKPFNCGNCHTTGWKRHDAVVNNARQDGLAGMDGTFHEPGIQCEACHGAGSTHAQSRSAGDIVKVATPRTEADFNDGSFAYGKPVACGECHTREGEADYPGFVSAFNLALDAASKPRVAMGGRILASGGLVRHHEQYDEILGVDPATLDSTRSALFMSTHGNCQTCHTDPHVTTLYREVSGDAPGVDSSNAACMTCHADYDPNLRMGGMKALACIDCHMPKMAKSAVATTLGNGVVVGDVTSHIFRIDVSTGATQFSGSFSNPYITVDWACRTCHGNDGLFDVSADDSYTFHNNK